ncbi:hypothetical protein PPYR_05676 [Photinus pyralis]|uniref:Uncharacterized protein n=1 Tax=Photinus pyralis TaxID=7054 RepID=A0A1Y1JW83_PHOPY|nr:uncharacterized protein LOC116166189 isoform X2 [Photinus pyralis]KAB0801322.1 hypothetical protein PPYR_05676 [Photinus pyralis]
MARVDAAEKEASEVLHSLLSVERIEKQEIIVERGDNPSPSSHSFQSNPTNSSDGTEGDPQIQWHTPVSIATHPLFSAIEANNQFPQTMDDQQVIWEGHTIQVEHEPQNIGTIYTTGSTTEAPPSSPKRNKPKTSPKNSKKKPPIKKKKKNGATGATGGNIPTKLEESAVQVKERFRRGCECQDESCFRGLNPESVYKHRLNIAELTKAEHDMYLMGVTMACLANPDETVRHKERRRLRAQYVYQGRRVCLDAFLYLENCTHYQLKRIRKHVMTHGVAPRVHGNHGKKPHNTFSLDIYRHATEFLKQYLETHTGEIGIGNLKQPIQLPWDITRKNLHDAYKEYGQIIEPGIKLMGYSTFRHFMKEQFPHVKFCKVEPKTALQQQHQHQTQHTQEAPQQIHTHVMQKSQVQAVDRSRDQQIQKSVIGNAEVQQVIPLVVAPNDGSSAQHHHQAAFLVTPVPHQIIQSGNVVTPQNPNGHVSSNTFSYQLTNTGYVINEQGNIVTTMANAQHHTPYSFNRM